MKKTRKDDRRFLIQRILVGLYGLVQGTGLLKIKPVQNLYHMAYFAYKKHMEDPFWNLALKEPELFHGGVILDIGAHIGYTSYVFASAIDPEYQIYAFEPDTSNFIQMEDTIKRNNLQERVFPVLSAVGREEGEIEFWHNKDHPGDNRVVTSALEKQGISRNTVSNVKVWSVDSYIDSNKIAAPVAFIKIDVQGYEIPVCEGMIQTLDKNPDCVLAVEYEPETLLSMGFEPAELINFLKAKIGHIYTLNRNGRLGPGSEKNINSIVSARGYVDLICSRRILGVDISVESAEVI